MLCGHTVSTGRFLSRRRHPVYDPGAGATLPGQTALLRIISPAGVTLEAD